MVKPLLTILPSGLRIMLLPIKDAATVTVQVFVRAGSEYETKQQAGISHFLEHMCFKGTEKRPTPLQITAELEGIGAEMNAFTTTEYTSYYAKGQARHWKKMLDVVSDIYLNSTFPDAELEKEKGVVIEEIRMYDDQPDDRVQKNFSKLLYGDQPAGRPVIGFEETVGSFTRNDLVSYVKSHYHGGTTMVVVSGAFEISLVRKELKRVFANVAKASRAKKQKTILPKQTELVHRESRDVQQTHMVYGFPTVAANHKDAVALRVLAMVLGGGASSRLFQILREEMGVCYYIYAAQQSGSDHGQFVISAGVTHARLDEVIRVLRRECTRVATEPVPLDELRRATEFLIGRIALSLESTSDWALWYGTQEILDRPRRSPKDQARELRAITPKDLLRVAKKYFAETNTRVAIVGPHTVKAP